MEILTNIVLLCFLSAVAIAAIRLSDLFAVTMLFGVYSFLTATFFLSLDAIDVAFTEAAVGAGVSTVLMLATLRLTGRFEQRHTKKSTHTPWIPLLVVTITGCALLYATVDLPLFGLADSPEQQHVTPHYVTQSSKEIDVPNIVTAILASYRGYDTLGETFVIFSAGLAVLSILGLGNTGSIHPGQAAMGDQIVLRVVVKILLPFILLFALYVQFHGDFGAGGGFQAGVIFAAAFILYDLVFGEGDAHLILSPLLMLRLASFGVLLYAGVGVYALLSGGNFLDYNVLSDNPIAGQHLGILLVELGVGITVFSVVLLIFFAFSDRAQVTVANESSGGQRHG